MQLYFRILNCTLFYSIWNQLLHCTKRSQNNQDNGKSFKLSCYMEYVQAHIQLFQKHYQNHQKCSNCRNQIANYRGSIIHKQTPQNLYSHNRENYNRLNSKFNVILGLSYAKIFQPFNESISGQQGYKIGYPIQPTNHISK